MNLKNVVNAVKLDLVDRFFVIILSQRMANQIRDPLIRS